MSSINEEGQRDLEMGQGPGSTTSPERYPTLTIHTESSFPSPKGPLFSPSPRAPALVVSRSGKSLLGSNSSKSLLSSSSCKALAMSNSPRRMDFSTKKKYVKQVTGRFKDTELHLAAQRGDLTAVREILDEINAQMLKTSCGAEFDEEVAEIRAAMVNETNDMGETALFTAAERGYIDVVKELLPYTTNEGITAKNRSGFDPLHIAANQGHQAIVQLLLDHDPELRNTVGQSNATPLISAATKGHASVVNELLSKDSTLLEASRSNGKNALHLAARQGHLDIVKALLQKDQYLARRTDKKGQTALHMAVKGVSRSVVRYLLEADSAIVMLPDKFGNTALHVATRKKRVEIVEELVSRSDTNVNALTRDRKTPLDIAEGLPLSEESTDLKECLTRNGAVRANELDQPRGDELRNTVTQIKNDVHIQLEQARKTNKNMDGIAQELRKLHRSGVNNTAQSVTVVAVLFATVAFAAIFTLPGGDTDEGRAVMSDGLCFKIFYFTNAIALFTSLSVVVVQITVVRGRTRSERRVTQVINKLMWLAAVCTTIAFIASSYIIVGRHNEWAAILITIIGGVIMAGVLGVMTYYVVKSKRLNKKRKKAKLMRSGGSKGRNSDFTDDDVNPIYAL